MINKLMIANRGEIAVRIICTCKKLNIRTVSVYSEADKYAPHVEMADESYLIGPPRVQESYLNAEKIIEIAKETKADAIHPGYGFLSENAGFAEQCEQAGLVFIGPKSSVIQKMGSKIEARRAMQTAGVPVVPGTDGAVATAEDAASYASQIGYPVMVKASAGGGGIGMQVVQTEAELKEAFVNNTKRAQSLFGDGAMFMEKKIENARHIEVQVLADHHGNVVHLFERECSIQRRNQKVIEEAPSPFISEETRQEMGEKAVQAAKALAYTNAGTIEFLVDEQENFYFLEMNTRIQVEHPITEEITGVDIVEKQLEIASGKPLQLSQDELFINGHAIEARIYAEDPKTFFPSPGHIDVFQPPEGEYIRNEVAVRSNYDVTPFYDPMIAKLVVHGKSREVAISLLKQALEQYKVTGIKTNIPMLLRVVEHEQFQAGNTTTSFLELYHG
ncbi:acetyl-CoA carboxylase biotin carboxylase subunit [Virgibacillus pantothenticus]|uniref:biotin carboxylase n=1 Tax=Virgibacillus pantothenticus TaxID=1473 RepID=A0A0L0QPZ0_VIRPA|nr:acetyl-CoA carboxylase biotin carboxylase subunit [Virgibacillus pantothenticus]KNE20293.1 biotin carboxylase [Virgibacillus pantothenticus]MED3738379.1 acetyl-CoA carboxylase biotin carboxylase subunit [Virgibacillus pantothenticus]QTY17957.1 acetyl-CoA carboxylase biotin carboxylase subunit [Virgibacillus pantothenticus]SIS54968.1 acetyl-CoA carboxylase, biotin carboxylase subunit [Virgibacillus pantothenticus]